jgi:hypothetical protein
MPTNNVITEIGTVLDPHTSERVEVTLTEWSGSDGRVLYTPGGGTCMALGGRDFARRHAAVRHARRVYADPSNAAIWTVW